MSAARFIGFVHDVALPWFIGWDPIQLAWMVNKLDRLTRIANQHTPFLAARRNWRRAARTGVARVYVLLAAKLLHPWPRPWGSKSSTVELATLS